MGSFDVTVGIIVALFIWDVVFPFIGNLLKRIVDNDIFLDTLSMFVAYIHQVVGYLFFIIFILSIASIYKGGITPSLTHMYQFIRKNDEICAFILGTSTSLTALVFYGARRRFIRQRGCACDMDR